MGNKFKIILRKRLQHVYITFGWIQLGQFYRLRQGGVVRLVYVGGARFQIKIKERFGAPVEYPTPPRLLSIDNEPQPTTTYENMCVIELFN